MAYKRSLVPRSSFFKRRYQPPVGYIVHDFDRKNNVVDDDPSERGLANLLQRRSFMSIFDNSSTIGGFSNLAAFHFHGNKTRAVSFSRLMSTTIGGESENNSVMSDVVEVLSDTTVQAVASQAPAVNEVAIAAADSCLAAQHFIDAVHSFTGLNWWSSIFLSTFLIRGTMIPFSINQLKSLTKCSSSSFAT